MNWDELPTGSIALIGHEANGVTARKHGTDWFYTHGLHAPVAYDDLHKGGRLLYAPGMTHG